MNPNDIDIEKLAREYARQEAATPPPSAWQKIQNNVSAASTVTPKKKVSPWQGALIGVILIAAFSVWQFARPEEESIATVASLPVQPTVTQPTAEVEPMPIETPMGETKQTIETEKKQPRKTQHENIETTTATKPTPVAVSTPVAPMPQQTATQPENDIFAETDIAPDHTAETHIDSQPLPAPTLTEETVAPTEETPVVAAHEDNTPLLDEKKDLFIPNLLTPNGDGINDYWIIPALQDYEDVQVTIFSAQGNHVYSNKHYKGEFSGTNLEEGTYYYQVVVKNAQIHRRGVLVIRR